MRMRVVILRVRVIIVMRVRIAAIGAFKGHEGQAPGIETRQQRRRQAAPERELRAGAELTRQPLRTHEALDDLLSGLLVVYPTERFAPAYARLLASTTRGNKTLPTMDLLIATAAILEDATLVTKNVKDFTRVPGLRVLPY